MTYKWSNFQSQNPESIMTWQTKHSKHKMQPSNVHAYAKSLKIVPTTLFSLNNTHIMLISWLFGKVSDGNDLVLIKDFLMPLK